MAVKQVIVIRTDLNMRKGKMAAQAAHGSLGIFTRNASINPDKMTVDLWPEAIDWFNTSFKKVVLGIGSEHELCELAHKAKLAKIPYNVVTDAGLTEFNGVPTITVLAIGPYSDAEIDKITGDLKLL
jgi:PTH2 family peptidyl-tRNA hydrolase